VSCNPGGCLTSARQDSLSAYSLIVTIGQLHAANDSFLFDRNSPKVVKLLPFQGNDEAVSAVFPARYWRTSPLVAGSFTSNVVLSVVYWRW
jgi:hypothetical protein